MAIYVGVNGTARKVKKKYAGVGGMARNIKAQYAGVNGLARKVFGGDERNWNSVYWQSGSIMCGPKYETSRDFSANTILTLHNPEGIRLLAGDVIKVYFSGTGNYPSYDCDCSFDFQSPDLVHLWGTSHYDDEEYHFCFIQNTITNNYLVNESYKSGCDVEGQASFTLTADRDLPGTIDVAIDRCPAYCELYVNNIQLF